jgi:hypothetical protein
MLHQAERGVTVFDHLRGMTEFKKRFATDQVPLSEIHVTQLGLRWGAAAAAEWMFRAGRRTMRALGNIRFRRPVG